MYILNKAIEWMESNMYLYLKFDTRIVIYFFFACSFEIILFFDRLPKPVEQSLIILLHLYLILGISKPVTQRDSPMYILNKAIKWMVSNMYLYLKCDTRIVIYFFIVCSFEMILF